MDILIKSFNRPYYLEKCLQSIFEFVHGYDKIIVLDDGTPQCYLDKIQSTFPQVSIQKSETYLKKSKAIKAGKSLPDSKIPIDFWIKSATKDVSICIRIARTTDSQTCGRPLRRRFPAPRLGRTPQPRLVRPAAAMRATIALRLNTFI